LRRAPADTTGGERVAHQTRPSELLLGDARVGVIPNPPGAGRRATFQYRGLLAEAGADQVFMHCGYGIESWVDVNDLAMARRPDGYWEAIMHLRDRRGPFSFCFKDSAGNWDSNNGFNWQVEVQ